MANESGKLSLNFKNLTKNIEKYCFKRL